ncbi:hypothetical protein ACIBF1_15310 [Spirillospora sp. NPDC050679]
MSPACVLRGRNVWWTRRRLDRLARALRCMGWVAEPRYGNVPPMLRVYAADVPCIGESVVAVRGADAVWWFRSSAGTLLAPCAHPALAAVRIDALLTPWVVAARTPPEGGEADPSS